MRAGTPIAWGAKMRALIIVALALIASVQPWQETTGTRICPAFGATIK